MTLDRAATLGVFDHSWAVLLTTYKRDGTPVGTPVNLAVEKDHAYFRTYDKAWKTKRIRHHPGVTITPCTLRGRPTGEEVAAEARLLEGEEDGHARSVIERRYPVFQRLVIPFGHRVWRYTTLHYEVSADAP